MGRERGWLVMTESLVKDWRPGRVRVGQGERGGLSLPRDAAGESEGQGEGRGGEGGGHDGQRL